MSRSQIGGHLDPRMLHFRLLDRAAQAAAIRRMANQGHSEHTIAAATGLSVEFINRVLAERPEARA